MTFHPLIEFGNRMLGVVVGIIALALLVAVHRREPTSSRPPAVKRLAWLILIGVGLQGLIGGITVWVDLHPAIVGSHMLISLALVAVSTYLLVRLRSPDGQVVPVSSPSARGVGLAMSIVGVLLLVLGVVTTGAGPHSGDAAEPYRWALDPAFVSRLHAVAVWVFVGLVVGGFSSPVETTTNGQCGRGDGCWRSRWRRVRSDTSSTSPDCQSCSLESICSARHSPSWLWCSP